MGAPTTAAAEKPPHHRAARRWGEPTATTARVAAIAGGMALEPPPLRVGPRMDVLLAAAGVATLTGVVFTCPALRYSHGGRGHPWAVCHTLLPGGRAGFGVVCCQRGEAVLPTGGCGFEWMCRRGADGRFIRSGGCPARCGHRSRDSGCSHSGRPVYPSLRAAGMIDISRRGGLIAAIARQRTQRAPTVGAPNLRRTVSGAWRDPAAVKRRG